MNISSTNKQAVINLLTPFFRFEINWGMIIIFSALEFPLVTIKSSFFINISIVTCTATRFYWRSSSDNRFSYRISVTSMIKSPYVNLFEGWVHLLGITQMHWVTQSESISTEKVISNKFYQIWNQWKFPGCGGYAFNHNRHESYR